MGIDGWLAKPFGGKYLDWIIEEPLHEHI